MECKTDDTLSHFKVFLGRKLISNNETSKWVPDINLRDVQIPLSASACKSKISIPMIGAFSSFLFNNFSMPSFIVYLRLMITGLAPTSINETFNHYSNLLINPVEYTGMKIDVSLPEDAQIDI